MPLFLSRRLTDPHSLLVRPHPCHQPFVDYRKGTHYLRSQDTGLYSRGVLNSGWFDRRETEPKDHDRNKEAVRREFQSTYDRIATFTDGSFPRTTYQAMADHMMSMKRDYKEQQWKLPMVTTSTWQSSVLDRATDRCGYAAVLPRHPKGYKTTNYISTNVDHHRIQVPPRHDSQPEVAEADPVTFSYKRCVSQFTDPDDYRRVGRNHWLDESGLYANSHHKAEDPKYRRRLPPFKTDLQE